MPYTTKKPTRPGFYWVMPLATRPGGRARIGEVVDDESTDGLRLLFPGAKMFASTEGYAFCGPIPDPAQLDELQDAKKTVEDYRKGIASTILKLQHLACGICEDKDTAATDAR